MPTGKSVILLIGAPGSGKTTVAPILSKIFNIDNINIQDLISDEISRGTSAGEYLALTRKEGRTPNDVTLMDLLRDAIDESAEGILLSDFPDNLSQARALDKIMAADGLKKNFRIVELFMSDEVAEQRLLDRVVHLPSGRPYNTKTMPPREAGKDDVTGEDLSVYPKDDPLLIKKNLFCYHLGSEPVLQHFGPAYCSRVEANCSLYDLAEGCCKALGKSVFKKELSFLERHSFAPMPDVSTGTEASVRVYNLGVDTSVAKDRNGNVFGAKKEAAAEN